MSVRRKTGFKIDNKEKNTKLNIHLIRSNYYQSHMMTQNKMFLTISEIDLKDLCL